MSLAATLLRANHIGVRELREHLSRVLGKNGPIVITEHGSPRKVLVSYEDLLGLVDLIDELQDPETMRAVVEAKHTVRRGTKGIPVEKVFGKIRSRMGGFAKK